MCPDLEGTTCDHSITSAVPIPIAGPGVLHATAATHSYDGLAPLLYGMIIKVVPCRTCADRIFNQIVLVAYGSLVPSIPKLSDLIRHAYSMILDSTSGRDREQVICRMDELGATMHTDRQAAS